MIKNITLTFGGVDLASKLSTYDVSYFVETADSITAIDGTEYTVTRVRPVLTAAWWPKTTEEVNTLYAALSAIQATATFTDPHSNTTRTALMRVTSNLSASFGLNSATGSVYYKGTPVVFRAVSPL